MTATPQNKEIFKTEVTLGQTLGFFITVLILVISNWIDVSNSITRIQERQMMYEQRVEENRLTILSNQDKMLQLAQATNEQISKILIALEHKENRK